MGNKNNQSESTGLNYFSNFWFAKAKNLKYSITTITVNGTYMKPIQIIEKYYSRTSEAYRILVTHSHMVYQKAFSIACRLTDLEPDLDFIYEACMLHDIGIMFTRSPGIDCYGEHSYICHGYLGREILEKEGLPRHALVCERHTGVGLTKQEIIEQKINHPHRKTTTKFWGKKSPTVS